MSVTPATTVPIDVAKRRGKRGESEHNGSAQRITSRWRQLWPESSAVSAIPAVDGMRALAVLLVVTFHAWWVMPDKLPIPGSYTEQYPINYGWTGVHLFFVLSGFLLFLPYARWAFGLQLRPSALLFYKRRLLRVGPAYWLCLALLFVFTQPRTLHAVADLLAHTVFLSNLFGSTVYSINGVFWTMAIEVQFYALLPLIGWAAHALTRYMRPLWATTSVVGALVVLMLATRFFNHVTEGRHVPFLIAGQFIVSGLPYFLGVFGAGIACSIAYVYLTQIARPKRRHRRRLERAGSMLFVTGAGLALVLAFVPIAHQVPYIDLFFGWSYSALLFGVLFGAPVLRRIFASPIARFVGLISYSFYLWHMVIMRALEPHLLFISSLGWRVLTAIVVDLLLSVVVAYLSYSLAERPFIAARRRTREQPVTVSRGARA